MTDNGNASKEQFITVQPTSTVNLECNNECVVHDHSSNSNGPSTNDSATPVPMDQSVDLNEAQTKPKAEETVSVISTDAPSPIPNNALFTDGNDGDTQSTVGVSSVGSNETTTTDGKDKNVAINPVHPISDSNKAVTMDEDNKHMDVNSDIENTDQSETLASGMPSTKQHQDETSVTPIIDAPVNTDQIGSDVDEVNASSIDYIQPTQLPDQNNDNKMDVESAAQVNNESVISEFTSLDNLDNVIDMSDNQVVRAEYLKIDGQHTVADPDGNQPVTGESALVDNHRNVTDPVNTDAATNIGTNTDHPSTNEPVTNEGQPTTGEISIPIDVPTRQFRVDKSWLDPQFHQNQLIRKPHELEGLTEPTHSIDENVLNRIQGSMIGMALGDALGAHVEFRPHQYLAEHPVTDLESGGTWGLEKGQFTDDTSMALCLANSLVVRRGFVPYDQLVRYKWWHKLGYMSSTGECFDIGAATRQSVDEFGRRQKEFAKQYKIPLKDIDYLSDPELLDEFNVNCSSDGVAGNGALMRLAPVPLFFFRNPAAAVHFSGYSGFITHGDRKAYDACRYYGALIVGALHDFTKAQLLDRNFYSNNILWFGNTPLHPDIQLIADGSYQKGGYEAGIRGKGYIVSALEAALWAFWSDENSFEKGALAAVNLGDDTDTTAAIYGQLAGAHYGYKQLPERWLKHAYAKSFMETLSKWIAYEGKCWQENHQGFVSQI